MKTRCTMITIIVIFFHVYSFSQPGIPIDSLLKANSDSWNVKIKQKGFTGNKPSFINFGPIKTVFTDAGKSKTVARGKDADLFWKTVTTRKTKAANMTLTFNEKDTAFINMVIATEEINHNRNVMGTVLNVSKDEAYKSSAWADEMIIEVQSEKIPWRFTKSDSSGLSQPGDFAKLQSGEDSFVIKSIDNLSEKTLIKRMFTPPAYGFVVFYEGKQVAAMQTMMRQIVWLRKDLDETKKIVLASLMAALFATTKLSNGNNFIEIKATTNFES